MVPIHTSFKGMELKVALEPQNIKSVTAVRKGQGALKYHGSWYKDITS